MLKFWIVVFVFMRALSANMIIYNATVYTVNDKAPFASALVIEDGTIVYVGSTPHALRYKNSQSKLIDAKGHFVMPGLIDAHTHTAIAALLSNIGVNFIGAKGKKEILQRIVSYKKKHPEKKVISGFGFYPYAFGPNGPTKEILDDILPDTKAFFISNNGHQAWTNSKTLKFLGITKKTPDPRPGVHYYVRNAEGEPTGFLIEGEAFWPHFVTLGIGTKAEFETVLKDYLPRLGALGITSIFDAGIPSIERFAFEALSSLEKNGLLPLRYFASHCVVSTQDAIESTPMLHALQETFNSSLLTISSIKFINDNADDDNYGIQFHEAELSAYLSDAVKANKDVMIHTSQDQAVHEALNAIETAQKSYPKSLSRFTLAHVNMVRDADFKRFSDLGVIANIQTFNAQGGGYYEYRYMLYDALWEKKLARYKHFFDQGVVTSASSDFPACNVPLEECTPFYGMEVGVTRQKIGRPDGEILESIDERLSVAQMIKAYTINAAYQLHAEKNIGSIEVGKEADLVILDKDPFAVKAHELHTIEPMMTFVRGNMVYSL